MIPPVMAVPRPTGTARKSAPVSPTVVAMTLMIQKISVASGTLFSIALELLSAVSAMGRILFVG